MIVVTGAVGFIGSCLVGYLNRQGINDLILVDDFEHYHKQKNWKNKHYQQFIHRIIFLDWFSRNANKVEKVYHLGARTDTSERNTAIFDALNVDYSKAIWRICSKHQIPLLYASSAATYGLGEHGYKDKHEVVDVLQPLNPYGVSKNDFDKWVLAQEIQPPNWYGLKFFNVYGPNEYHKSRMASVILHAFRQISNKGEVQLFKSHHVDYQNGKQRRDFIYVKDVVQICSFLMNQLSPSGIYNVGTGQARTFLDLATAVFAALNKKAQIKFIDTPKDIRGTYQYFTQANMDKLCHVAAYPNDFTSLENGITDYVQSYLIHEKYY